jgi:hypothetical protein
VYDLIDLKDPAQTVVNVKDRADIDETVDVKYVSIKDLTQIKDHDIEVSLNGEY